MNEQIILAKPMPDLATTLSRRKSLILICGFIFSALLATYSLVATEWYTAKVILSPTQKLPVSSVLSQLSSLGGVSTLLGGTQDSSSSVAYLESDALAKDLIERLDILDVLSAPTSRAGRLIHGLGRFGSDDPPDMRDAVMLFQQSIRSVEYDKTTGLVVLRISWTDPNAAAEWANALVAIVNSSLRTDAIRHSQRNVEYLKNRLGTEANVAVQQSIAQVIEGEIKAGMIAESTEHFAFRVVDPAVAPKYRSSPVRSLLVALGAIFGLTVGAILAIWLDRAQQK
jgi:uncharacterized protein involved in exopolysaccharide biosynthesis